MSEWRVRYRWLGWRETLAFRRIPNGWRIGEAWVALALTAAVYLLAGCGTTLPADAMQRIAHSLEAMRQAYMAVCEHREETDECTRIRGAVNQAIDAYTEANDAIGQ